MFKIDPPYVLFLGDVQDPTFAKTAFGIAHWRPDVTMSQVRMPGCAVRLPIGEIPIEEAAARGARTMIVGVSPDGGAVSESWIPYLLRALDSGLDLAAGLHHRLADIPAVAEAAARLGRQIHDIRHPRQALTVASGKRRSGRRLLTVGTDCAVGKKYTALAVAADLTDRGVDVSFRATGQTGIFITGNGVCIDTVVADFVSGAAEATSPSAAPDHWDIIEGQGALFHPSYAGVSLGLLHGSQPDALILCHEEGRQTIGGLPDFPLPSFQACMKANIAAALLTHPSPRFVGISINTASLDEEAAYRRVREIEEETWLPTVDPIRMGVKPITDRLLAEFSGLPLVEKNA